MWDEIVKISSLRDRMGTEAVKKIDKKCTVLPISQVLHHSDWRMVPCAVIGELERTRVSIPVLQRECTLQVGHSERRGRR